VQVDGDRAPLGVEHLEDASHKPFGNGVLELTRNRDDGLGTLVSGVDTEQLGLRGLYVVRASDPLPYPAGIRRMPGRNPTPNPTRARA
jgi:hypothetical protein